MSDSSRWRLFGRGEPAAPEDSPAVVPANEPAPPTTATDDANPAGSSWSGPRGERVKTVAVRLTPDEHARWVQAAEHDGRQQLGRWVRESVDDRLAGRPDRPEPAATEEVRAMRAELSHLGSNLNQIAKALNIAELGGGTAPELRVVAQVIDDTRKAMAALRDELQERA